MRRLLMVILVLSMALWIPQPVSAVTNKLGETVFLTGTTIGILNDPESVGVSALDVSDPATIVQLDNVTTDSLPADEDLSNIFNGTASHGIKVSNGIGYITSCTDNQLTVLNTSDPTNLDILAVVPMVGQEPRYLDLNGEYLYIPCSGDDSLQIYSLADPDLPSLVGAYTDNTVLSWPEQVYVNGNYAYIADRDMGLVIIDVSDPTNPTYAGEYEILDGECLSVRASDNYAYMTVWQEISLLAFDVSVPATPVVTDNYAPAHRPRYIDLQTYNGCNVLYLSTSGNGHVYIFDVDVPGSFNYWDDYHIGGVGQEIVANGNMIYVGEHSVGGTFHLLNVTLWGTLQQLGTCDIGESYFPYGIAIDESPCIMQDAWNTGADSISETICSDNQSFQYVYAFDNRSVNWVNLYAIPSGNPSTIHVYLYDTDPFSGEPLGAHLAEGTYDASTIDPAGEWISIGLDATVPMIGGQGYNLVVTQDEPDPDYIVLVTTTTDGGGGYYAYSLDGGVTWNWAADNRDALFELWYCVSTPATPTSFHIIAITQDSITLAWQESTGGSTFQLVYKLTGYPASEVDGTVVYFDNITSYTTRNLIPGTTYYFGVWAYSGGAYSPMGSLCAATTSAGYSDPTYGSAIGDTTDETILGNSPIGGFIDFMSQYGRLPEKTVGLIGYSSILLFVLLGVACYNRSVALTIICGIGGLALGVSLGVFAVVFLIIAIIGGLAIGTIRGGQPTGG